MKVIDVNTQYQKKLLSLYKQTSDGNPRALLGYSEVPSSYRILLSDQVMDTSFPKTMYKYVIKIIDWTLKKVCIIYIFILLIWKVCTY